MTDVAKAMIRTLYGRAPQESYFMGCSNGEREAMQAAMRFPTEFDGIVAGNPGFHFRALRSDRCGICAISWRLHRKVSSHVR